MLALRVVLAVLLLIYPTVLVVAWTKAAEERLTQIEQMAVENPSQVPLAAQADEGYCSPQLKQILRRVLNSCGLIAQGGSKRGCQPLEVRNVATMSGADFNALFIPMIQRGGIAQFDRDSAELDMQDQGLVETVFANRRGASYFLVVSRASPEGSTAHNRELSRQRAEAVLSYLQSTFRDAELERQIGLLWLGEEYAQLEASFCNWRRSGSAAECTSEYLNRSAFIAWIDCQL